MLWNDIKDDPDIDIISYLQGKSESIKDVLGEMDLMTLVKYICFLI